MLELRQVSFVQLQPFILDFKKKSRSCEAPPDGAKALGIFVDSQMAGYFILVGYTDATLEINQGYLKPDNRHKRLSYLAMKLLQAKAKSWGYRKIVLRAGRSLKAYSRFMDALGYKPEAIIFSREL